MRSRLTQQRMRLQCRRTTTLMLQRTQMLALAGQNGKTRKICCQMMAQATLQICPRKEAQLRDSRSLLLRQQMVRSKMTACTLMRTRCSFLQTWTASCRSEAA